MNLTYYDIEKMGGKAGYLLLLKIIADDTKMYNLNKKQFAERMALIKEAKEREE